MNTKTIFFNYVLNFIVHLQNYIISTCQSSQESRDMIYRGADKSLARPGRKQARKHVRDARDFDDIETRAVIKFFFSCKARRRRKFTPF